MSNPFEDDCRDFLALRNAEEQYSIWPHGTDVPAGWQVVHGPASRREVLDYVEQFWTDMRPKSLRNVVVEDVSARA